MIDYSSVSPDEEIRQGDIFINLPFVDFDLEGLMVISDDDLIEEIPWKDLSDEEVQISSILKRVKAIVISQDCDCLRETYISLAVVSKWNKNFQSNKKWMTSIISLNNGPSKMYMPPDTSFKIPERLHIEFSRIFKLPRSNLYNLRDFRVGRLNSESLEHFQHKIAFYFGRYAFNEYYPLNTKEMDEYEDWRGESYERRQYQIDTDS